MNSQFTIFTLFSLLTINGYAESWPKTFDAPQAKYEETELEGFFKYTTKSYIIFSDQKIDAGSIARITTVAESVNVAMSLFPIMIQKNTGDNNKSSHIIRLYSNKSEYLKSGATKGTVGYFDGRSREVKIDLEYLLSDKRKDSNLNQKHRFRVLVHELVHQSMGHQFYALPTWLREGIAEYFSATHYSAGRYNFTMATQLIKDQIQYLCNLQNKDVLKVPSLRLITMMSSNDWDKDTIMNKDRAYTKYASSLLLCHYLIELSSRKFKGMKIFLDASWNDYSHFQIKRNKKLRVDQSILWGDKNVSKIEFQILHYWKSKGLNIKFINPYKSK